MNRTRGLWVRLALILAFFPVGLWASFGSHGVATAARSFTVNSESDSASVTSALTLREAIRVADGLDLGPFTAGQRAQLAGCTFNSSHDITGGCGAGGDIISFASSITQIDLTSALPAITLPRVSVYGDATVPVRIDGSHMTPGTAGDAITLDSNNALIYGLAFFNLPATSSTGRTADIRILSGRGNRVVSDVLGVFPGASSCRGFPGPDTVTRNSSYGVYIGPQVTGDTQSPSAYLYSDVIGCHAQAGVYSNGGHNIVMGQNPTGTALGDYIGVSSWTLAIGTRASLPNGDGVLLDNHDAAAVLRNSDVSDNRDAGLLITGASGGATVQNCIFQQESNGVRIQSGAGLNGIGILTQGFNGDPSNLISGNSADGVLITGAHTAGNYVYENKIGTDGSESLPNYGNGVHVTEDAHLNYIGSFTADVGNVISGNRSNGVLIDNGASENTISANYIGTDVSGTDAIPNGAAGVDLQDAGVQNVIGHYGPEVIAGNGAAGILMSNTPQAKVINDVFVGVASDGRTEIGNRGPGIEVNGSSFDSIKPQQVSGNTGPGVLVTGASIDDTVIPEHDSGNGGLPILLGIEDPPVNDNEGTRPGPDHLLNFPVIEHVSGSSISGTTYAGCQVYIYQANSDPGTHGGGGSQLAEVSANSSGIWTWSLPPGVSATDVSLIAVTPAGDSSEMSPLGVVSAPSHYSSVDVSPNDSHPTTSTLFSGRVYVALNPNGASYPHQQYLAASVQGGLWKSNDSGQSWNRLAGLDRWGEFSVSSLAFDPNNAGRVYAVARSDGQLNPHTGVYSSTDGGDSWSPAGNPRPISPECPIGPTPHIVVSPLNSTVFATFSCKIGIMSSPFTGFQWVDPATLANPSLTGTTSYGAVSVAPDGTAFTCSSRGVYMLPPSGTWQQISASPAPSDANCATAVDPVSHSHNVVFVSDGTPQIVELDAPSSGATWTETNLNAPPPPYPNGHEAVAQTRIDSSIGPGGYDLYFVNSVQGWVIHCDDVGAGPQCTGHGVWALVGDSGYHGDILDYVFDPTGNHCVLLNGGDGGIARPVNSPAYGSPPPNFQRANCDGTPQDPGSPAPSWLGSNAGLHDLLVHDMNGTRMRDGTTDLYIAMLDNGFMSYSGDGSSPCSTTWCTTQVGDGAVVAPDTVEPARRSDIRLLGFSNYPYCPAAAEGGTYSKEYIQAPVAGGSATPCIGSGPPNLSIGGAAGEQGVVSYANRSYLAVTHTGSSAQLYRTIDLGSSWQSVGSSMHECGKWMGRPRLKARDGRDHSHFYRPRRWTAIRGERYVVIGIDLLDFTAGERLFLGGLRPTKDVPH